MRFREGDRKVEVKWRTMVGREGAAMRLRGVEATFPFVRDGRASTAKITADECLYQPQPQEASFRGNVQVRTDDGLELDTERLDYKADEGVARTDERRPLPARRELGQRPRARLPVGGRHPRPEGRREAAPGERSGAADGHRSGDGEGDPGRAPCRLRRRDARAAGRARAPQRAPAAVLRRRDRRDRAGGGDRGRGPAGRPGRADARHGRGRGGREAPALSQAPGVLPGPGDPVGSDGGQPGQPGGPARPARRAGAPPAGDRTSSTSCSTRRGG